MYNNTWLKYSDKHCSISKTSATSNLLFYINVDPFYTCILVFSIAYWTYSSKLNINVLTIYNHALCLIQSSPYLLTLLPNDPNNFKTYIILLSVHTSLNLLLLLINYTSCPRIVKINTLMWRTNKPYKIISNWEFGQVRSRAECCIPCTIYYYMWKAYYILLYLY